MLVCVGTVVEMKWKGMDNDKYDSNCGKELWWWYDEEEDDYKMMMIQRGKERWKWLSSDSGSDGSGDRNKKKRKRKETDEKTLRDVKWGFNQHVKLKKIYLRGIRRKVLRIKGVWLRKKKQQVTELSCYDHCTFTIYIILIDMYYF